MFSIYLVLEVLGRILVHIVDEGAEVVVGVIGRAGMPLSMIFIISLILAATLVIMAIDAQHQGITLSRQSASGSLDCLSIPPKKISMKYFLVTVKSPT